MMRDWKLVENLAPGDMIRAAEPHAACRVVRAYQTEKTPTCPGGIHDDERNNALAWIVIVEVADIRRRGERFHTFQHPKDKVLMA